jgi:hypothetical protein
MNFLNSRSAIIGMIAALIGVAGCQSDNGNCQHCNDKHMKMSPATQPAAQAAPAPMAAPAPVAHAAVFGTPGKISDDKAITVPQLMSNIDQYKGEYVRVTGTVDKVCPRKGCWMTLKGDGTDQALFVKFPDPPEGRLLPMEAAGKPAAAEGTVKVKEIPAEMAKHYAEESGATPEQLAKITGPQKQITLASPSVSITGVQNPQTGK